MAVSKAQVLMFIKSANETKKALDKESRRLRTTIKKDYYQVMDTRVYEWQLQKNAEEKRKLSKEIAKAKKMLMSNEKEI